jgi:phage-related protein
MTLTNMDFSLDGVNASTKNFETHNIFIPPLPEIEEAKISIPKLQGEIETNEKFLRKPIRIKGTLRGTSYSNLLSNIATFSAYLGGSLPKEFIRYGLTDRYYLVKCKSIPEPEIDVNFATYEFTLNCADPFAYDTTATTSDETITSSGTTYIVANGGHTYAFPVITFTFNQDMQHIYVANNTIVDEVANRFDISKAFSSGDVLVVDCKNGTIKLNGANSPAGFGDGGNEMAEWIMLAVGNNEIEVGTTDGTIDVTVDISFEKVYLY